MNELIKNPITHRIYEICETKKISQSELGRRINKRQSVISSWGQNETEPPTKLLPLIAEALDVSITWLITGLESADHTLTSFSEDEQLLLQLYEQCNQEGKNRIMEQAEFIASKYPQQGKSSEYKIG